MYVYTVSLWICKTDILFNEFRDVILWHVEKNQEEIKIKTISLWEQCWHRKIRKYVLFLGMRRDKETMMKFFWTEDQSKGVWAPIL